MDKHAHIKTSYPTQIVVNLDKQISGYSDWQVEGTSSVNDCLFLFRLHNLFDSVKHVQGKRTRKTERKEKTVLQALD